MGASLSTTDVVVITVSSTLGILAAFGLIAWKVNTGVSGISQTAGIINWFKILYYFLPYSLFLFGIIYDGLNRSIQFFPAGFFGLGATFLNSFISSKLLGVETKDADVCSIPGMSTWGSNIAPQNMLFTSTVLSYIATYVTASQSDGRLSGAAWGGVGIAFVLQLLAYYRNECFATKPSPGGWVLDYSLAPPMIALAEGMLIGGLSGWGLYASGAITPSGSQMQNLGSSGPAGNPSSTAGAGKCSPTSDDDAFVCEAYKNGELVTSTIVG